MTDRKRKSAALIEALLGAQGASAGIGETQPPLTWGPAPPDHPRAPARPMTASEWVTADRAGKHPAPLKRSLSLYSEVPGQWTMGDRINDMLGFAPWQQKPVTYDPSNYDPTMSTGEDMGRSAITGAQQGLTGLAGGFGNARDAGSFLGAWLADNLAAGVTGGKAASNRDIAAWSKGAVPGLGGVVGAAPTSAPFDQRMQQVAGAYHQPQTAAGRWSQRVAGMWPAALGSPGGVVPRAASVVIPGTTSFAASEVAPEGYKDAAGAAGAILGGLATGALFGGSPPESRMLADKTPEISPAQQQAIVDALERGDRIGMQPTVTEAIDANVPGARTTALQQYAEGTPRGVDVLGPRMAARPDQMRNIVGGVADQLAPETSPVQTEVAASEAANAALRGTRGQINQAAQPFYEALRGEVVPPGEWAQLQNNPSFMQGLADLRNNPVLNRDYANLPDNSIAVVNEALKRVQTRTLQATPNPANPTSDATLMGAYEQQGGQVNTQMRGLSPNWAQARDIVAQGRQTLLTPQQEGPLGVIAGRPGNPSPGLGTMTESLFPSKPFEGQPNVTADALAAMDYQQPGVSGQLARQFLQRQAAESAQQIAGKPNTFAPSNFSTTIAANPIQRDTILGAVSQSNPQAGEALADALDTFDTTGRRLAVGSNTVDKNATSAVVESGGRAATAILGGGSKRLIADRLMGWASQLEVRMNQRAIVDAINANPQQAATVLQGIEAARGNTALQRSLFTGLLAGASSSGGRGD